MAALTRRGGGLPAGLDDGAQGRALQLVAGVAGFAGKPFPQKYGGEGAVGLRGGEGAVQAELLDCGPTDLTVAGDPRLTGGAARFIIAELHENDAAVLCARVVG